MQKYFYDDFIIKLATKINNRLSEISADYNFDFGDEFELAICELLRSFLPSKYGICRGFVVNKAGEKSGDDIIIYDQERFPTLNQIKKEDFSRKENIPIEAVYCYIEAKYTLDITSSNKTNLKKAIKQVKNVKILVQQRSKYELNKNDPYHSISKELTPTKGIYPCRNPIFSMIISRYVSDGKNRIIDPNNINNLLNNFIQETNIDITFPEGIVTGQSHYVCTSVKRELKHPANFIIPNDDNQYMMITKEDLALAIGFIHLYTAIDWIRLDKMPWDEIFNDSKNN